MLQHTKIVTIAAVVALIGGCSESTPTDAPHQGPVPQLTLPQQAGPRRDDTPWRRMTDAELTAKVAEASGRAFIGFKDPAAGAGVDETGRVLVSRANVAAAKAQLSALGLQFEIEFIDMPTVVTRIPFGLVPQLRANPLMSISSQSSLVPITPRRRHGTCNASTRLPRGRLRPALA